MFYVLGCKQSMDEKCLKNYLLMVLNKKNALKFDEKFIKTIMKIVIKDTHLKQMSNNPKNYMIFTMIYHSYQKERRFKNVISLFVICTIKKNMLHT